MNVSFWLRLYVYVFIYLKFSTLPFSVLTLTVWCLSLVCHQKRLSDFKSWGELFQRNPRGKSWVFEFCIKQYFMKAGKKVQRAKEKRISPMGGYIQVFDIRTLWASFVEDQTEKICRLTLSRNKSQNFRRGKRVGFSFAFQVSVLLPNNSSKHLEEMITHKMFSSSYLAVSCKYICKIMFYIPMFVEYYWWHFMGALTLLIPCEGLKWRLL